MSALLAEHEKALMLLRRATGAATELHHLESELRAVLSVSPSGALDAAVSRTAARLASLGR